MEWSRVGGDERLKENPWTLGGRRGRTARSRRRRVPKSSPKAPSRGSLGGTGDQVRVTRVLRFEGLAEEGIDGGVVDVDALVGELAVN